MSPPHAPRLVLGVQPVREVLRAHKGAAAELWLQQDTPRLQGLAKLAEGVGVGCRWVARKQLDQLAKGAQHQGAAVWAPALRFVPLGDLLQASGSSSGEQAPPLLIALDQIVDPQNFGAVIRSAVGVAGAAVVWAENGSAPLTPATFRASAGAIEHARLCRTQSLPGALADAAAAGMFVVGLDAHAPVALHQLDLTGPCAIVVGSEGKGLHKGVRSRCGQLARLALPTVIDSLNASVAAAIALYEARRQRGAG